MAIQKNKKKQKIIERLVLKINNGTFDERDIKELLSEFREYAAINKDNIKLILQKSGLSNEIIETYAYLIDIMHAVTAHNLRDRGDMYDWVMGKINFLHKLRIDELNLVTDEELGLKKDFPFNGFVIDERMIFVLQMIIYLYLQENGSSIQIDFSSVEDYKNDILLCVVCILQASKLKLPNNNGEIQLFLYSLPEIGVDSIKAYVELWGDIYLNRQLDTVSANIMTTGISKTRIIYTQEDEFSPHMQTQDVYAGIASFGEHEESDNCERDIYEAVRDFKNNLILRKI